MPSAKERLAELTITNQYSQQYKENFKPPMTPQSIKSSSKSAKIGESARKGDEDFHTPKLAAQDNVDIRQIRGSDSNNSNSDHKQRLL